MTFLGLGYFEHGLGHLYGSSRDPGTLCPEIVYKSINVSFPIIFSISKNLGKFYVCPKIDYIRSRAKSHFCSFIAGWNHITAHPLLMERSDRQFILSWVKLGK